MAEERFRLLEPLEYHKAYLNKGLRVDGRKLDESRSTSLQLGVVSSAHGSAMVKQGDTAVMATVKAEIGEPDILDNPGHGMIQITIDTNAPNSTERELDMLSQIQTLLNEMASRNALIPLDSLCLKEGVFCWVIYVDILCLDVNAALLDTCLLGLCGALHNTQLPAVSFPDESEFTNVELATAAMRKRKLEPQLDFGQMSPLQLPATPAALSFSLYRDTNLNSSKLIVDPSEEELQLLQSGLLSVIVTGPNGDDQIAGIHHFGYGSGGDSGTEMMERDRINLAVKLTRLRQIQIVQLISKGTKLILNSSSSSSL